MSLLKGFMCQVVGALLYNLTIDYVLDANRKASVMKDEVASVALACVVSLFCFGVQVFTDKTEGDDIAASSSENTDIEKTKTKEVPGTKEMDATSQTTKAESMNMRETASVVKEPLGEASSKEAKLITTVVPVPPITEPFKITEFTAPEPPPEVPPNESELSATVSPETQSTEPSEETELTASATPGPPLVVEPDEPKLSATVMPEPLLSSTSVGQVVPKPPLATASEEAAATEKPKLTAAVVPEPPLAAAAEEPKLIATVEPPLSSAPEGHVPTPLLATASEEPKVSAAIMPEPPLAAATDEPKLSATVVPEPLLEATLEENELKEVVPEPLLETTSEERGLIMPVLSEITVAATHEGHESSATPENTGLKNTIILEPQLTVAGKETELLITEPPVTTRTEETELIRPMSEASLEPTTKELTVTVPELAAPQETEFATSKIPRTAEAHEVDVLTSTKIEVPTENMCMVDRTTFETLEIVSGEMKEKASTADETSVNMDNVFSSPVDTVVSGSVDSTPIMATKATKINAGNLTAIGTMDLITFSPLIWTDSESELELNEKVGNAAATESLELVIEDVEAVTSNTVVTLGSFKEELKDLALATEEFLIDTHTLASTEAGAKEKMDVGKSCTDLSPEEVNAIELATEESSTYINALSSAESVATMVDETIQMESTEMTHSPAETEAKNLLELGESTEKVDVIGSVTVGVSEGIKVLKEVDMTPNVVPTSNAEEINTTPQVIMDAQQTDIQIEETSPVEDSLDTASSVRLSATEETDVIASTETEATPVEEMNEVLIEFISMSDGDAIASSETKVSSDEIRMDKLTETDMLTVDSNATESMNTNVLTEEVETTTKVGSEPTEINAEFSVSGAGIVDMVTSSKIELSTEVDDINILTEAVVMPTQEVKPPESTAAEVSAKKLDTTTFGSEPLELNTSSVKLDSPTLITDRWPTVTESLAKFRKLSEDQVISTLTEESKARQEMVPSIKENVSAVSMSVASETSEAATMRLHTPAVDVSFLYTLPNS